MTKYQYCRIIPYAKPTKKDEEAVKASKAMELLSELDPNEEIVIAWWRKELFPDYNDDTDKLTPISDEVWNLAILTLDDQEWNPSINEAVCDSIMDFIDKAKEELGK